MRKVLTGNQAVAYGVFLSRAEVISAYPITPQTTIMENLAELWADGVLEAKFLRVESEHSAMASIIGASMVGARTFTATSSQGLALMHEMLHWAAGARLPIVMVNVNRALGAPWNIWSDQTDSLSQRDTGWIQLYCENNQEVLDTIIQAYMIAETVSIPVMVVLDAFFLSHTSEVVEIPEGGEVEKFLPPYRPRYRLDVNDPHSFNLMVSPDYYQEFRYKIQMAMEEAKVVAEEVDGRFAKVFSRGYGLVEDYLCDEAELILVTTGTVTSTSRQVISQLRQKGQRVGLLKIKMFRPFPVQEVRAHLKGVQKVAVIDRNISFGCGGIFAQEIKAALCDQGERPQVFSFVTGLGGRDITPSVISEVIEYTRRNDRPEKEVIWVGMRG
ncbi:MAG: pyruvate ferredoxin oxidoreductase [Deltaproteobacteria bacterium]|nr:MAG: pyruvate ferredoxin oxidoreductase [Deltaproteobacteria bacterium]